MHKELTFKSLLYWRSIAFGMNPGGKNMRDSRGWMVQSAGVFIRIRIILLLMMSGSNAIAVHCLKKPFNVSYDHRALIIDGQRRMLISAGVHYRRATPEVSIYSLILFNLILENTAVKMMFSFHRISFTMPLLIIQYLLGQTLLKLTQSIYLYLEGFV